VFMLLINAFFNIFFLALPIGTAFMFGLMTSGGPNTKAAHAGDLWVLLTWGVYLVFFVVFQSIVSVKRGFESGNIAYAWENMKWLFMTMRPVLLLLALVLGVHLLTAWKFAANPLLFYGFMLYAMYQANRTRHQVLQVSGPVRESVLHEAAQINAASPSGPGLRQGWDFAWIKRPERTASLEVFEDDPVAAISPANSSTSSGAISNVEISSEVLGVITEAQVSSQPANHSSGEISSQPANELSSESSNESSGNAAAADAVIPVIPVIPANDWSNVSRPNRSTRSTQADGEDLGG
jgi:hypothetical protein